MFAPMIILMVVVVMLSCVLGAVAMLVVAIGDWQEKRGPFSSVLSAAFLVFLNLACWGTAVWMGPML